jgi:hypothetical protein
MSDEPVARPLPNTNQNKHRHPCLDWDWDPKILAFDREKIFLTLDRLATVIGYPLCCFIF